MNAIRNRDISPQQSAVEMMAQSMHESAAVQADASPLFVVYPANTDNPELDFLKISLKRAKYSRVNGRPFASTPDELDFFAGMIENRYFTAPDGLRGDPAIRKMGELIAGGNHIALGDTHGELFDVPANLVNVSGRLREADVRHRSALVASKGIDYLGVSIDAMGGPEADMPKWMISKGARVLSDGTIPARSVLGLISQKTYFTAPVTRSFQEMREDNSDIAPLARRFNAMSRIAIAKSMIMSGISRQAPLVLALGLSGTKIKDLDVEKLKTRQLVRDDRRIEFPMIPHDIDMDKRTRVIGKVSSATVDMIKGMYLFPTATDLDATPATTTIGEMLYMDGHHDTLDVGAALVELELLLHPESQVVYDIRNKLPVKR